MHKRTLQQVSLVSDDGRAQSRFPGGWALKIFDALHAFAPAFANVHTLPITTRTQERIKGEDLINPDTYTDIEKKLIEITRALFPRTSAVNDFAAKYVNEYFRLWKVAAEAAPRWVGSRGYIPSASGVIARALIRDLVLRLCYLESCERKFRGTPFSPWELTLLRYDSPAALYGDLVTRQTKSQGIAQVDLAEELTVTVRSLSRFREGKKIPQFAHLVGLAPTGEPHRLLAGIGFCDQLLRTVGLRGSSLMQEILHVAESFLPNHRRALDSYAGEILPTEKDGSNLTKSCGFESFASYLDNLLLHPGFESIRVRMPGPIWRCHLATLKFATIPELAQAYFQCAEMENERGLEAFLRTAEKESGGSDNRWIDKLRQNNNVLAFPGAAAQQGD